MQAARLVIVLLLALSPFTAKADPIVVTGSCVNDTLVECAFGIENLALSSGTFDVEIVLDSYFGTYETHSPYFFGDMPGAIEAATAITALLNSHGSIWGAHGHGTTVDTIIVPYAERRGGCAANRTRLPGDDPTFWRQAICGVGVNAGDRVIQGRFYWTWTRFAGVPEPGTFALLAIGLAGMGLTRRRRKASVDLPR